MSLWSKLRAHLSQAPLQMPSPHRLDSSGEGALAASIKRLPVGVRGWISLENARRLFSREGRQYAFGELDEPGKQRLSDFAESADHRCQVDIMPGEARVYFTRQAA